MTGRRKAASAVGTEQAPVLLGAGLGRIAYEAYLAALSRSSAGSWDELVENEHDVAAAWCAAGQAVIAATFGRKG